LDQLVASPGHDLFVLSLQIEPAGYNSGTSVPDQVAGIESAFGSSPGDLTALRFRLAAIGYRDEQGQLYDERFSLRSEPRLIPADDGLPKITREGLDSVLGSTGERIQDVRYRVDMSNLGYSRDSQPYERHFGI